MSKQQQTVTDRLEANGWVVNKFRQMDSSRRLVTENQIRGEGVNHPWMDRQLLNTDGKLLDSQWWWVDGWWIIRTEGYFPGILMLVGGGCGGEWMDTFCCCWLWSHGLQHARLPCPSPSPGACSNSCPLSQWCHPTISSSVIPFSCLQSLPASGSFHPSQFFPSGGQSIGVSALASVLPVNIQDLFPLGLTCLISLVSKGLPRVFSNTTVQKHQFFGTQLPSKSTLTSTHDHWKNHSLD